MNYPWNFLDWMVQYNLEIVDLTEKMFIVAVGTFTVIIFKEYGCKYWSRFMQKVGARP